MTNQQLEVRDDMSLMDLGGVLAKSGYFVDSKDAAQAIVKVLAGRELGFGPIASMSGIYIVKGKPTLGANLIAAAVKRSGRYDYRIKELTEQVCTLEFFALAGRDRESIGISSFSLADAKKAGTQNLDKFARNMLFARAMSNGAKWFCADVFGGPIYTPEELGERVDGEGQVIESAPARAANGGASKPAPTAVAEEKLFDEPEPAPLFKNSSKLSAATVGKWGSLVNQARNIGLVMNYDLDETDTPEIITDRVRAIKAEMVALGNSKEPADV